MNLFIKVFTAYLLGFSFFCAVLPSIIVNSLNSDKTEIKENPFKYSHVLINN